MGKTLQISTLILVKTRKDMNNLNCRRDITEVEVGLVAVEEEVVLVMVEVD